MSATKSSVSRAARYGHLPGPRLHRHARPGHHARPGLEQAADDSPNSYAFYFCITWLPTYLKEQHGFTAVSLGIFAGLPLILSVLGDLFGGLATDAVTRRFGLRIGRAALGAAAYLVAGVAMILSGFIHRPVAAAILISVALAASMFTLAAAWGTCQDIGGNHAGVVSAAMNTSGQIGSVLSGHEHKYDDVRCTQFGLWRDGRREHPPKWGCDRRATKPQAKFGATRRAAGLFRPDFVARSLQIHCGICSSLVPRLGEKSLAANVIVFMFMTT